MSAAAPAPCARVAAHLSAYVDEELAPRERRAVALHLARCADCRAERDAILALGRVAREAPSAAPAAGLAARVRSRESARRALPLRRAAASAALALLGAAALAGAYLVGRAHGAADASSLAPRNQPLAPVAPEQVRELVEEPWDHGVTGGPLLSPR